MKFLSLTVAAMTASATTAFVSPIQQHAAAAAGTSTELGMILEKPAVKKISKLENLKVQSANLIHPLKEVSQLNTFFLWDESMLHICIPSFWGVFFAQQKNLAYIYYHTNKKDYIEVTYSFFPRLIDTCRRLERPRPMSQWTFFGVNSDRLSTTYLMDGWILNHSILDL